MGISARGALVLAAGVAVFGADCSFLSDPDRFLQHDFRARQAIQDRLLTLDKGRNAAASVSIAPITRKNFIDDAIFGKLDDAKVAPAPLASDEEFFRRVSLDLTGRIPSPGDVRALVADANPTKRSAAIDKLLNSPEFNDKWTMWLGDLVENNATSINIGRNINGRNAFYKFLAKSVAQQTPLKDVVFQILTASGNNFDEGASGYTLNGSTPGGPIQDTYDTMLFKSAREFLGLGHYDCLLCHNGRGHLDALSVWGFYTARSDAEHMAAFFSRTAIQNNTSPGAFYNNSRQIADMVSGNYEVPTSFGNRPDRPRTNDVGGNPNVVTPVYRDGTKPSSDNWRSEFAQLLVNDPLFSINMANRVWKEMFNLGLVDSVDALDPMRLDPDNPPGDGWDMQATHPALLVRLGKEFAAGNYSLRELLRTIAESSAYQLSSRYPGDWSIANVPLFARHYPRRLLGEEVHDAITKATGALPSYAAQGLDSVQWAMQLPDTSEPRGNPPVNTFLNLFLRGDRDTVPRSQGSTILQAAGLMNDTFVMSRIHVGQSPTLQAVSALGSSAERVDALYLAFLGRLPSDGERQLALAHFTASTSKDAALEDLAWALVNKLEFQFSY